MPNINGASKILLAAMAVVCAKSLDSIDGGKSSESEYTAFEFEDDGSFNEVSYIPRRGGKTNKFLTLLASNDFLIVRTLFKIKDLLNDLSEIDILDFSDLSSTNMGLEGAILAIAPYLSENKLKHLQESILQADSLTSNVEGLFDSICSLADLFGADPESCIARLSAFGNIGSFEKIKSLLSAFSGTRPKVNNNSVKVPNERICKPDADYSHIDAFFDYFEDKGQRGR
ncbi:MAG: hypothetical protein FWG10_08570 [Eubacteriaceae bacterium]|nr:hypothetical protein [Eubacteriaceae bacterium]